MNSRGRSVAIVGAGRLARAVGAALARSGRVEVTIASRRPFAAAAVARGVRGLDAAPRIADAVASADIVLLAVADRAIAAAARDLVPMRATWRGVVVLHAAGAFGPELLAELGARGAAIGVWHPLAVLAGPDSNALSGAAARIEGAPAARAAARCLSRLVGCVPLRSPGLETPSARAAYHAAASLASNDVVALLAAAQGLLVRRGVAEGEAIRALTRLAEGAIAAIRRMGAQRSLTGPVARNDAETLRAQLRALGRDDPEAARAHRALSLRLVTLAAASGRLDRAGAQALRRMLKRGPGRSGAV